MPPCKQTAGSAPVPAYEMWSDSLQIMPCIKFGQQAEQPQPHSATDEQQPSPHARRE